MKHSFKLFRLSFLTLLLGFSLNSFATDSEDYTASVMHHIGDAHQFQIAGSIYMPLPCIAYSSNGGFFFSLSNVFEYDALEHTSHKSVNGYMIHHDQLFRLVDADGNSPKGVVEINHGHEAHEHGADGHGKTEEHGNSVKIGNVTYKMEPASALQGLTSWYDFSITKNVFGMLLITILLILIFGIVSSSYKKREGKAPKGIQSLFEVLIVFIRDEVIKPAIGEKWEKFFPYLMTAFFFILFANLLGLLPVFPGTTNITGNLGVTIILAFFTFIITNINGNRHYWGHVFAMPGVPLPILIILTPIEIVGLFIKPVTLFIRLFANITAGHIIILSLVSLIFVFSEGGQNSGGAFGGAAIAVPFVFVMNFLELFVAFLQAFIFTLLSSLYIGSAIKDHHHEHGEEAHH